MIRNPYFGNVPTESVDLINDLATLAEKDRGAPEKIFATVTSNERKKAWTESTGLKETKKMPTLKNFIGPNADRDYPPGADHMSIWNKDGKPYAYVMQPYQLSAGEIKELTVFCEEHNLSLDIDSQRSWDYPGRTLLVVLTKKEL